MLKIMKKLCTFTLQYYCDFRTSLHKIKQKPEYVII